MCVFIYFLTFSFILETLIISNILVAMLSPIQTYFTNALSDRKDILFIFLIMVLHYVQSSKTCYTIQ